MDREKVETIVSPPPVDNVGSVDGRLTLKESSARFNFGMTLTTTSALEEKETI